MQKSTNQRRFPVIDVSDNDDTKGVSACIRR
jgi:hypothetical protein